MDVTASHSEKDDLLEKDRDEGTSGLEHEEDQETGGGAGGRRRDDKLGKRCSMFEGMGTFGQAASVLSRAADNGRGLFAQSYLVFIINALKDVWAEEYTDCFGREQKRDVSVATLVGAVVGMFVFGLLIDTVGKRSCAVLVSLVTLIGAGSVALMQPFDPVGERECVLLFDRLTVGLFVIGLGFGGEYPVSASLASDASKREQKRGRDILLSFAMQGWANLASVVVVTVLYNVVEKRVVWRLSIALAMLIIVWTFVERIFAVKKENRAKLAPSYKSDTAKVEISTLFVLKYYGKRLLGTTLSWFLLDVVFYGNALFAGAILTSAIGPNVSANIHFAYLLLFASFAMPGYYAAAFTIDEPWLGRRKLQMLGFLALGFLYIFIGSSFNWLQDNVGWFIFMYALTFIFSGFGPNTTTYLVPSEVFATQVRGTLHGISAASGKMGAVVGVFAVAVLEESYGSSVVLVLLGSIAFLGAAITNLFVPETLGISLDAEDSSFAEAARLYNTM